MIEDLDLNDFLDELVAMIEDRFKFNKFYYAEVKLNADPIENRGGVFVECVDLNAIDPLSYIRADVIQSPRAGVFPAIGDTGYLFFVNANPDQAKFLPGEGTLFEATPLQTTHTVVESPTVNTTIQVDELTGVTIESKSPAGLISSPEPMVLGDKLVSLMNDTMSFLKKIIDNLEISYDIAGNHKHMSPMGPTSPALPPEGVQAFQKKSEMVPFKAEVQTTEANYVVPGQLLSPSNKNN
jgi:hypothetical protein